MSSLRQFDSIVGVSSLDLKVEGSVPGQRHVPWCRFDPWPLSGLMWEATLMILSRMLSLLLKKINEKKILGLNIYMNITKTK